MPKCQDHIFCLAEPSNNHAHLDSRPVPMKGQKLALNTHRETFSLFLLPPNQSSSLQSCQQAMRFFFLVAQRICILRLPSNASCLHKVMGRRENGKPLLFYCKPNKAGRGEVIRPTLTSTAHLPIQTTEEAGIQGGCIGTGVGQALEFCVFNFLFQDSFLKTIIS